MLSYLRWQFIDGPVWLMLLAWNLQHFLVRFFSVPVMLRTLVSHWHKDAVSYRQGSITGVAVAFAWNQISRGIGMIIRSSVLIGWIVMSIALLGMSVVVFGLFIAWPFLTLIGSAIGVQLLL